MNAGMATNKIDFSWTWYENKKNTKLVLNNAHINWSLVGRQNKAKFEGRDRVKVVIAEVKAKISLEYRVLILSNTFSAHQKFATCFFTIFSWFYNSWRYRFSPFQKVIDKYTTNI